MDALLTQQHARVAVRAAAALRDDGVEDLHEPAAVDVAHAAAAAQGQLLTGEARRHQQLLLRERLGGLLGAAIAPFRGAAPGLARQLRERAALDGVARRRCVLHEAGGHRSFVPSRSTSKGSQSITRSPSLEGWSWRRSRLSSPRTALDTSRASLLASPRVHRRTALSVTETSETITIAASPVARINSARVTPRRERTPSRLIAARS